MDVQLMVAGAVCALLAFGHWAIGMRWVLPGLSQVRLGPTPFGPPSLSRGMVRFTWHVVTVVLVAFATLLFALALAGDVDVRVLLLRWLAVFWAAAAALAVWESRSRLGALLRFPVPFLFVVVAVFSWWAST